MRRTRAQHMPVKSHFIVPRTQHCISKTDISPNALQVLNRLNHAGFQAYLVGGSVRDLLLRQVPKDFDIATNATPPQIRKLFRNARIIGRRFKLVHIIFYREIIEVATFRGDEKQLLKKNQKVNEKGMLIRDNVFGTIDEDAWRRDFTINSLYYNLDDASIVDFTGGVQDIHERVLRVIGNPEIRYKEDPVRMLRALRFSAKLDFRLAPETVKPLVALSHLIQAVASSRLFDEVSKLYQCGSAVRVHELLVEHGLFSYLFEQTANMLKESPDAASFIALALENTDQRIRDNKPITPAFLFAIFLWFPLKKCALLYQNEHNKPPLLALEEGMTQVIFEQNRVTAIPKRFSQIIREIWLLQYRFYRRNGNRAYHLLEHPRFRAAYDFLVIRALAGDESIELAEWWTSFQEKEPQEQEAMIAALPKAPQSNYKKKRPKRAKPLS